MSLLTDAKGAHENPPLRGASGSALPHQSHNGSPGPGRYLAPLPATLSAHLSTDYFGGFGDACLTLFGEGRPSEAFGQRHVHVTNYRIPVQGPEEPGLLGASLPQRKIMA